MLFHPCHVLHTKAGAVRGAFPCSWSPLAPERPREQVGSKLYFLPQYILACVLLNWAVALQLYEYLFTDKSTTRVHWLREEKGQGTPQPRAPQPPSYKPPVAIFSPLPPHRPAPRCSWRGGERTGAPLKPFKIVKAAGGPAAPSSAPSASRVRGAGACAAGRGGLG